MANEIDKIVRMLEKTFDGIPWYGNSIQATLSDIDPEIVNKKNGPTHNIIELILHMVSWRVYVIKRLQGENSFKVTDETNFPKPTTWLAAIELLNSSQKDLVEVIKNFPEARLSELVPEGNHRYTFYTLIHGIIQHDIYHLGQIAYIKKSFS